MNADEANAIPSSRTAGRIPELDGLRGVAITLVVITHCLNLEATPGEPQYLRDLLHLVNSAKSLAWSGVDLFFVLSGFLIGMRLLETRLSPKYFRSFYARRARRILPIFLLFLGSIGLCYVFVYPAHRQALGWTFADPLPWYSYLTFTTNIWMAHRNVYGAWGLAVLWSLAVEEQFYLIAPFVIRFVRPARLPYVFATGIVSALGLRCLLQFFLGGRARMALYVLLPCRADSLLWGMLAAYAFWRPAIWNLIRSHRKWVWTFFFALAGGICLASLSTRITIHSRTVTTIGYDWLALFYMTALLLVLIDPQSWLGNTMRCAWLRGLGTISYGLYLIHYTIYGLSMAYLLGHSGPVRILSEFGVAVFAIVLAIALATVSWHFFEKPLLSVSPGAARPEVETQLEPYVWRSVK